MLRCVMVLYGDLIETFEECILPLHCSSIKKLRDEHRNEISFEIYTKDQDEIFQTENWKILRELVNVSIHNLEMPPELKLVESNWLHGQIIDDNDSGDYFCPMCPDWIISQSFYKTIFDFLTTYDNLLCYCPRTERDQILGYVSMQDSISEEELLRLGVELLHPSQKHLFIDNPDFAYWASAIWFPDLSVCCFHPHPLVMKLQGYKWPGGSVDGYMTGLLDINKTGYLCPTTLPIFEFSGPEKSVMRTGQPFSEFMFRDFVSKNITERQRYWFNKVLSFGGLRKSLCPEVYQILELVNSIDNLHVGPTCQIQS